MFYLSFNKYAILKHQFINLHFSKKKEVSFCMFLCFSY